uniref:Ig-like domain-containing protein n=1 Tax=Cyprinus carpio TaxID=7962 RepID=A0A8C1IWK9_CYPCA
MAICKILFFLLALCVWCGKCEVFYKRVGDEVSMKCGVDSNSDIDWKFNGESIFSITGKSGTRRKGSSHIAFKASASGDTLKVPRLETRDSGNYFCRQSGKHYTVRVVSAFVKPGPVLLQSSNAELHCDITGDPNTEVQWLRPPNGEEYKEKKQVIQLKSVTSKEAGQWTCLVKKDLKLIVALTVVGLQTTAVNASKGDNIELPCSLPQSVSQRVVGGRWKADHLPKVSFPTLTNTAGEGLHWNGNGLSKVNFTTGQLSTNFDVTLKNVQSSDDGTFVCTVEFDGGVSLSVETTLRVMDKPSGKTKPHSLCVWCGKCEVFYKRVGDEVSMKCGVDSNSDIDWKFNGESIFSITGKSGTRRKGSSHIAEKASTPGDILKVPRLETRDSGNYFCKQSGKHHTVRVVSAFVKPGPVLLQSSNAELHCDITGDPNTEVQWQRPPNGEEYKEKKQVIHLKSVTSEEAGQWTCLVEKKLKLIVTLTVVGWCLSVVVNQNELFFNYYYNVSHFMSVTFVWVSNRPPDHSC